MTENDAIDGRPANQITDQHKLKHEENPLEKGWRKRIGKRNPGKVRFAMVPWKD